MSVMVVLAGSVPKTAVVSVVGTPLVQLEGML